MPRLLIHVEGQTEESFVNEILRDHLVARGYDSVGARILGNARLRRQRGGIRPWPTVENDIVNHLRQDTGCIATTMVDFYALPQTGDAAWPGRAGAQGNQKGVTVQSAMLDSVATRMGGGFRRERFVPFVVVHEFEGLLFSDCAAFGRGIGEPALTRQFQEIRRQFACPEDINDSPETAPSKRVENLVPGYEKPLFGTLAAIEVGLEAIRNECPHFSGWLQALESLVPR